MKRTWKTRLWTAAVIALPAAVALAGPVWFEFFDAGPLPFGAQTPGGQGPLERVVGQTSSAAAGLDFEDMYVIFIDEPLAFRATTDPDDPELFELDPFADFDTQLWLFSGDEGGNLVFGFGLLGNNDHPETGSLFSLLRPFSDDGLTVLTECGEYFLAISGFNDVPSSDAGEIFFFRGPTEISGPDGLGGLLPISTWSADGGATGSYGIALRGVRVPPPCRWDCGDGDGAVGIVDLLALLGTWGNPALCACDFDGGGAGVTDLLKLLANWGPCPP